LALTLAEVNGKGEGVSGEKSGGLLFDLNQLHCLTSLIDIFYIF
jgi:hypothetical protein